MPNWIEGVLKLRGTKESITRFIHEGISYGDFKREYIKDENNEISVKEIFIPRQCKIDEGDYYITISNTDSLHIKGTRRMFINSDKIEVYFHCEDDKHTVFLDVKRAWRLDENELLRIATDFGLDLRIFGTESSMEFCQLVEIVDGKVTIAKQIDYKDFDWECPDPRLGG